MESPLSWIINNATTSEASINSYDLGVTQLGDEGGFKLAGISESGDELPSYSPILEFIVVGIGITVVTVVGIIGNAVSACVLSRAAMRSSICCLLLGLTLSDSILILCSLMLFGLPNLFNFLEVIEGNPYMQSFYPAWGPSVYALAIIAQTSSIYFTIAVTVERYLVVCCPLQSRYLCTWKRTKIVAACIFLFAFLYNLPRWWELRPVADPILVSVANDSTAVSSSEATVANMASKVIMSYQLDFTEFRLNPIYVAYYINWGYLLIMCLFPFAILLTLNILIYLAIRRSNKSRHGIIASHPTRDYSFAIVLFCVTATFLICNTLALVINLMESMWKIYIIDMENVSNFLITLNSSVNCAIYCAFGNKFREQLYQMRDEVGSSFHGLIQNVSKKLPRRCTIKLTS